MTSVEQTVASSNTWIRTCLSALSTAISGVAALSNSDSTPSPNTITTPTTSSQLSQVQHRGASSGREQVENTSEVKTDEMEMGYDMPNYASLISNQVIHTLPYFELESGAILEQVPVAYKTWGKLNDTRDNVMVICHAFTGSADVEDWLVFYLLYPEYHYCHQSTRTYVEQSNSRLTYPIYPSTIFRSFILINDGLIN
jgi:hypothetical protein